jgi:putative transposase
MVSPAQRRAIVGWARDAYRVSERRACVALRVHRALVRYRSVKPDDAPVRRRLHELARDRPSFGVKRLHTMLRRDGLAINHKKVHRLYVEEGLQLRARRRRRRASVERQPRAVVLGPNERDRQRACLPWSTCSRGSAWRSRPRARSAAPTSPGC